MRWEFFVITLLIRDRGAAGADQVEDFVAFESGFLAPAPEVGAAKVEGVAELNRHVERHEEAKGRPDIKIRVGRRFLFEILVHS